MMGADCLWQYAKLKTGALGFSVWYFVVPYSAEDIAGPPGDTYKDTFFTKKKVPIHYRNNETQQ